MRLFVSQPVPYPSRKLLSFLYELHVLRYIHVYVYYCSAIEFTSESEITYTVHG